MFIISFICIFTFFTIKSIWVYKVHAIFQVSSAVNDNLLLGYVPVSSCLLFECLSEVRKLGSTTQPPENKETGEILKFMNDLEIKDRLNLLCPLFM